MAGKYQAYPEYQNSGVRWFGLVPKEWLSSRLKFESLINMGQSPSSDDCNQDGLGIPFLQGNAEFGIKSPSPKQYCEVSRKIANKGDLLFSVRAPVGALNLADQEYGIGRGLCAITNNEGLSPDFLWWLIPVVRSELDSVSTGSTFEAVSAEQVENVLIFKPSIFEQQKIANFLDHETAKIDTLIEKQQQLIKLLKEKRQAVISHAVTKGLNPDAPMRDSGVEWLGEVPEHWEVSQLKYKVMSGTSITYGIVQAGPHVEDGIPYIKTSDMSGVELPISGFSKTSPIIDASYQRSKVYEGDIVMAIRATVGKCLPVPKEIAGANLTQGTAKISPGIDLSTAYLLSYLSSSPVKAYLNSVAKGATFKEITLDMLRRVPVFVPPKTEQVLIAERVSILDETFSRLVDATEEQMRLLSERRTALISASVTGKIDARNWQAPESSFSEVKEAVT